MPDPARPGPHPPGAHPPEPDPYKVLQVDPEADPEVVQAAYRRLAQKYHPDVAPGPEAAARMIAINGAWETLRDPGRRAEHDRARAAREQARVASEQARAPRDAAQSAATRDPGRPAAHGAGDRRDSSIHEPAPSRRSAPFDSAGARPVGEVTRNWTSGRSSVGSGYDPSTMRASEGHGAAGPPPGNPSGSVLPFGRYAGWSLGEIARRDLEFLEWLERMTIGRPYRDEIDAILRRAGRRRSARPEEGARRGLFRRR